MKGLEINEVNLSYLKNHFRIDSEFYQLEDIEMERLLLSKNSIQLGKVSLLYDGPFGSEFLADGYEKEGVPILRMQNIKANGLFNRNNLELISESDANKLAKYTAYPGEVVSTKIGFLGYTTILPSTYEKYIFRRELTRFQITEPKLNPYYLSTFLNSRYGRKQFYRYASGTSRDRVLLINQRETLIPLLDDTFQKDVQNILMSAFNRIEESEETFIKAENFLLQILGLKDFQLSKEPVNVKSFLKSLGTSGRLDAEYYQKKYEQVVDKIKSNNFARLIDLVNIKKSIEPGSAYYADEGLPFVRVSDYDKFGLSTPDKYLTNEFCRDNDKLIKGLKPKKETILFSKDGSVGTAYMLREDADFITSGAILHLKVRNKDKLIPEYLTLVLNSKLVQMQAERDAGGSIILHWRVSEIENVVVPVIDFDKQQKIANLVEESFKLKKESEHLLEVAKSAVEIAIEQNEKAAINYISKTIG